MRVQLNACVCLFALTSLGCGSLYAVRRGDLATAPVKVEGVPFYVKRAVCVIETVYSEPVYHVLVSEKRGDESPLVLAEAWLRADKARTGLNEVRRLFAQSGANGPDRERVMTGVNQLATDAGFTPTALPAPGDEAHWVLLSHASAPRSYVDYSRVYYLNVRKPWIGSASATAELAADGTLTKGQAEVEDKTAETILGMLPAKELLQALGTKGIGFDAEGKVIPLDAKKRAPALLQLTIESDAVRHTFAKAGPIAGGSDEPTRECPPAFRLTPADLPAAGPVTGQGTSAPTANATTYRRELPGAKKESEKQNNEVTVSGTITLPKPAVDKK